MGEEVVFHFISFYFIYLLQVERPMRSMELKLKRSEPAVVIVFLSFECPKGFQVYSILLSFPTLNFISIM